MVSYQNDVGTAKLEKVVIRFAGDSGDGMQLTGDRFTHEAAAFSSNNRLLSFQAGSNLQIADLHTGQTIWRQEPPNPAIDSY